MIPVISEHSHLLRCADHPVTNETGISPGLLKSPPGIDHTPQSIADPQLRHKLAADAWQFGTPGYNEGYRDAEMIFGG